MTSSLTIDEPKNWILHGYPAKLIKIIKEKDRLVIYLYESLLNKIGNFRGAKSSQTSLKLYLSVSFRPRDSKRSYIVTKIEISVAILIVGCWESKNCIFMVNLLLET